MTRMRVRAPEPYESGGRTMHFKRYRYTGIILLGAVATLRAALLTASDADDEHAHPATSAHIHAPAPASYATITAPPDIWTNPAGLARGPAIHPAHSAF